MYSNPEICAKCGGKCCKRLPGFFYPQQLGETDEEVQIKLTEMLKTGRYSIDRWEGDPCDHEWDDPNQVPYVFMIRPRGLGKEIFDDPFCEETICLFLGPKGCELAESDRPMNCQLLEPRSDENCIEHHQMGRHGKHEAAMLWRPYRDIFDAAINESRVW